jgi:hypothetical protein
MQLSTISHRAHACRIPHQSRPKTNPQTSCKDKVNKNINIAASRFSADHIS